MGALANAAKFASDETAGGFKDQALAALVNKARSIVVTPDQDAAINSYARAVLRSADRFRDLAAWVAATDATVSAQTAPSEAQINTAVTTAWPYLAKIDT